MHQELQNLSNYIVSLSLGPDKRSISDPSPVPPICYYIYHYFEPYITANPPRAREIKAMLASQVKLIFRFT